MMSSLGPFPPLTTVTFAFLCGGSLVCFLGLRSPIVHSFLRFGLAVTGILLALVNVYFVQGMFLAFLFLLLAMFLIFAHVVGRVVFGFFRGLF